MNVQTLQQRLEQRARERATVDTERAINSMPCNLGAIIFGRAVAIVKDDGDVSIDGYYVLQSLKFSMVDALTKEYLDRETDDLLRQFDRGEV